MSDAKSRRNSVSHPGMPIAMMIMSLFLCPVSNVSVVCRFDCVVHNFTVVVSEISACICAFHNVPLALHIGKVVTDHPVRLLLSFTFALLLINTVVN